MLNRHLLFEFRRALRNSRWNADAHLRAHERSVSVDQEAIARIDTCQLAANSPIEDFYSAAKCLSSNAFLFGVFDGHGGQSCSRHISVALFPYICASVLKKHEIQQLNLENRCEWLFSSADAHLPNLFRSSTLQNVINFHQAFSKRKHLNTVREALKFAFEMCDEDLCRAALPDNRGQIDRQEKAILLSVMTAASGSCATLAHIRGRNLHVANVGDSAAVLGVVTPNGSVTARQLSRAHCIDNTDEVVLEPLGNPAPPNLHTPPYLTVSPEVFYHKLTANDKFLVLASDGLWEWLDPDTVVRLVYDHTVGTMTLLPYQPKSGSTLKQVPPGRARNYRDDISIIVIHFNEKYLEEADESSVPAESIEMQAK
ncbi:protein phosphatase 2C [Cooperia oncophora]